MGKDMNFIQLGQVNYEQKGQRKCKGQTANFPWGDWHRMTDFVITPTFLKQPGKTSTGQYKILLSF